TPRRSSHRIVEGRRCIEGGRRIRSIGRHEHRRIQVPTESGNIGSVLPANEPREPRRSPPVAVLVCPVSSPTIQELTVLDTACQVQAAGKRRVERDRASGACGARLPPSPRLVQLGGTKDLLV